MRAASIILLKQNTQIPPLAADTLIADINSVKQWVQSGAIFQHLFRYHAAQGYTYHIETLLKPLAYALLLRAFSHGQSQIIDQQGNVQPITFAYILKLTGELVRDFIAQSRLLRTVTDEVNHLLESSDLPHATTLHLVNQPLYLRTDLVFGLQSGGSVGHIAGVLNHLGCFSGKPIFLTTDHIPTVHTGIEQRQILPTHQFREFPALRPLVFNVTYYQRALANTAGKGTAFIYHRYSVNSYAALKLARHLRIPFVLEFNGPEVWVHRHWGNQLPNEDLAEKIELANLRGAHVIVVVSQVLKDGLLARGIEPDKILVNPNGVDTERYAPTIDGNDIRRQYNLEGKTVVGFIGTFGPWHGAEVLATAFGQLLQAYPSYRQSVRLLLIGDGVKLEEVRTNLAKFGVIEYAILTGVVPQAEGPTYLAACDILASPHVPNADGTPFFGSPTKLFEYMAMGKGIVASKLEQIGDILEHDQTAWLVTPGDADSLLQGLKRLVDDVALRQRLGRAARAEVVQKYTWQQHTQRIIKKLQERCSG